MWVGKTLNMTQMISPFASAASISSKPFNVHYDNLPHDKLEEDPERMAEGTPRFQGRVKKNPLKFLYYGAIFMIYGGLLTLFLLAVANSSIGDKRPSWVKESFDVICGDGCNLPAP